MKIGKLLYAEPTLNNDINFNRSVVLLVEENKLGTVGFILNKKTMYSTLDLVPELNQNFIIYNGGPVEKDNLYFIHNIPELINNSINITETLYWGGDFEKIISLVNDKKLKINDIKFFLGYSGWSPKQLDIEIESKSWIINKKTNSSQIFKKKSESLWKDQMKELGGKFLLWSNSPENPYEN